MSAILQVSTQPGSPLANHAEKIRDLIKRTRSNIVEIGKRLTECKDIVGHGNWLPWLDREFRWTDKTAENYINIHKLSLSGKFENFSNLNLPLTGLYLLAAPSTPPAVRKEIIECAEKDEKLTVADIKGKIAAARSLSIIDTCRKFNFGEKYFEKLRGTSLDRADEKEALVVLNRGAPNGESNPTVQKLINDAAAGKDVSAIVKLSEIRGRPTKRAMARIAAREAKARASQDVGPNSADEVARLNVRIEEQQNEIQRLRKENLGLRSEIKDLKDENERLKRANAKPLEQLEEARVPGAHAVDHCVQLEVLIGAKPHQQLSFHHLHGGDAAGSDPARGKRNGPKR